MELLSLQTLHACAREAKGSVALKEKGCRHGNRPVPMLPALAQDIKAPSRHVWPPHHATVIALIIPVALRREMFLLHTR